MRILKVGLAFTWMLSCAAAAQSIRVATYELEGLAVEALLPNAPASGPETKALRQVADNLTPLDADVVVMHGLPNQQVASRLATQLRPGPYHLTFHGAFRKSGTNSQALGPPITIFTRKQAFAASSIEWRVTGQLDWPGGFAFVGLNSGTNAICVYVAHLPGEPAALEDRESPLMARRRDLAAQYLVLHADWLGRTLTNQLVSALITGDFIADRRAARSEGAVRILQQAGFGVALPNSSASKPGASTEERPALLTSLFARNAALLSTARVSTQKGTLQYVVSYEVEPGRAISGQAGIVPGAAQPIPFRVVALDDGIVWVWVGGISALATICLFFVWVIHRAFWGTRVLGRRSEHALVLARGPFQTGDDFSASGDGPQSQAALWPAGRRGPEANATLNEITRPQLSHLLRERLIGWLSLQRRTLLDSHESGTRQVLELETRLHQIQGQFDERLRTREARIAELERDILAKEKVIRDLLRAQVRMTGQVQRE